MSGLSRYIEVFIPVFLPSLPRHQLGQISSKILFRQVVPLIIFSFPHAANPCFNSGPFFHSPCARFSLPQFECAHRKKLSLVGDLLIRWHGIGGRTVSKTREYDLGVVEEFAPNVVIMQLDTNDLTTISAVETGSAIEDLCRLLWRGTGGAGSRENRGREGYGRREKKGRQAGSLRWREAGEKFKKSNFFYLLLLTSSQRNEPNNVS